MGETAADASTPSKPKPTILVPPRGSMGFLFSNGSPPGFSPGPMTLLSSFFPDQTPFSFSQLLAGAMASPLAPKPTSSDCSFSTDGKNRDTGVAPLNSSTPTNLAAAPPHSLSPLFMVPTGLSPNSPGYLSPLQSPFGMSHQQALAHVTAQAAMSQSFKQMQAHLQHSSYKDDAEQPLKQTQPESSKITEPSEASQSDKGGGNKSGSSDGYNWRKYGQKHVKTSECPRGYYKCTHLNCPVKKKVERSSDGGISEVTYKGQHNHDPPKPNKRGKDSCGASDRTQVQTGTDRLDEVVPFHSDSANHHPVANNNDGMEDSAVVVYEGNGSEPIAKKRSLDVESSIPPSSHKTAGESKIVLQTRSEVDLLNDGYKWRKYGQKVVKGNPHPRSYYRCTYAGCNVRKHVERASADPAAVITTYEGKHNHEIPMGRYSNSHGSVNPQPSKTQKMVSEKPSLSKEIDYGKQDQMPITLQLKDEQIAA